MLILENAKTRYATKVFNPNKSISEEQIQAIKELVRFSPSSTNVQPWHFILAKSDEGRKRVAESIQGAYSFNERKVLDASLVLVLCGKTGIDEHYLSELLETENHDGRLAIQENKAAQHKGRSYFVNMHRDELKDVNHWMAKQVCLNLGSLLLGVSTMGIDAVPIEGFDSAILDKNFGLKEKGHSSLVIVSLGYHSVTDFNSTLPKSRWPARWPEERIITEY
ncbi:Oxygen-insensitive NAD(P)H nitroreductase [invertebrate metagenome]|uniref:Oxygen-insensitive NAD(P)H nitroreductase n=1 Tax=invertebrate metagenome TaxID=1711999 RepID=A0A2H9T7I0_9ZZZZ